MHNFSLRFGFSIETLFSEQMNSQNESVYFNFSKTENGKKTIGLKQKRLCWSKFG